MRSPRLLLLLCPLLLLVAVACYGPLLATANGCGEPLDAGTDQKCSDWQCGRSIPSGGSPANVAAYCVRGLPVNSTCLVDADCFVDLQCLPLPNTTSPSFCQPKSSSKTQWAGFIAIAVAAAAFGTNFVPARSLQNTGNGLLFQFFMTLAILMAGFCVQMYQQTPYFHPYAMLGGMMWCLGNTLCVVVIQMIGMGLGVALWGASNMILGWASGRFGLWGVTTEPVKVSWLSYASVFVALVAILLFALVRTVKPKRRSSDDEEDSLLEGRRGEVRIEFLNTDKTRQPSDLKSMLGETRSHIFGVVLAIVAGCLIGLNFDPPQHLMDNFSELSKTSNTKYSNNGLDYVFSHFVGIFFTSAVLLVGHRAVCVVLGERVPQLFPTVTAEDVMLPGFACGLMWAAGDIAWFVANTQLGLVVSFPIICLAPSIIACLWSTLYFREIAGLRNYLLLIFAVVAVGLAAVCTVLAKQGLPDS